MKITRDKAFFIGIDFQERLMPVMRNKEELTETVTRLFQAAVTLKSPVFFSQQYTKGLGGTIPEIKEAAGMTDFTEKIRFSAYDDMKAVLPPPDERPFAIISGIESHICVLQTAIDLKAAGYQPVLVTDCISSRKKKDYKAALKRAEQEGILLVTSEMILYELLETAAAEERKAIQKILM